MNITTELMALPGVMAAGEYAYRGDRYSYEGNLNDEMARMASVMCRATSLGVHMECNILESVCHGCGLTPGQGWAVRGADYTVCVINNIFCFLDNEQGRLNDTLHLMLSKGSNDSNEMV